MELISSYIIFPFLVIAFFSSFLILVSSYVADSALSKTNGRVTSYYKLGKTSSVIEVGSGDNSYYFSSCVMPGIAGREVQVAWRSDYRSTFLGLKLAAYVVDEDGLILCRKSFSDANRFNSSKFFDGLIFIFIIFYFYKIYKKLNDYFWRDYARRSKH